jgi:ribosomal-protein-alanine N-acetyltransferase
MNHRKDSAAAHAPVLLGDADLDACLALDRRGLAGLWTPGQWRSELESPDRPVLGLYGEDELLALACGWLVLDELHITAVVVDPGQRRRGLGHRVLAALLAHAGNRGAERATLEVAVGNAAARALYAALGFRDAGLRRGYYRSGEDALIQWARIGGPPAVVRETGDL